MTHNINEQLESLKFPIDQLDYLPDNPKIGNIERVKNSYATFGQRKPIVARREPSGRGTVLAGNTQLRAARALSWTHIAVLWVEDDEKTAAAFALADNRSAEGGYDVEALLVQLERVGDDFDLLEASGYDLFDKQDLMDQLDSDEPFLGEEDGDFDGGGLEPKKKNLDNTDESKPERESKRTTILQYALVFDNEEQQQSWYTFLRWLRQEYPDVETTAARLDAFLSSLSFNDGSP